MEELFIFLRKASRLYDLFRGSDVFEDVRNKSIIKLEAKDTSLVEAGCNELSFQKLLYYWAYEEPKCQDARIILLQYKEDLQEELKQLSNELKNTDDSFVDSCIFHIEIFLYSLSKDDRYIFTKRLLERFNILLDNDCNFNFIGIFPSYMTIAYTQKEDRNRIWEYARIPFKIIQIVKNILSSIIELLGDFNIDITNVLNEMEIPNIDKFLLKEDSLPILIEESPKKAPKATLAQQWAMVRNLMECAVNWRLTNDANQLMYNKTDVAKFLAFLCGGSEDRIRKHLEDELAAKDVNEILPYLENIGLHEISNRIKKDAK